MAAYVIAYDISHDRRRERVARTLLRYGIRIQKSVFLTQLDSDQLPILRRELSPHLHPADQLEIIPIDSRRPDRHFIWNQNREPVSSVVVVG